MAVFATHRSVPVGSLVLAALALLAIQAPVLSQAPPQPTERLPVCTIDLKLRGVMRDVLSNALMHGCGKPEAAVAAYLRGDAMQHTTSEDLLRACAKQFAVPEAGLKAEVERFRHCNCTHALLPGQQPLPLQYASPGERDERNSAPVSVFA